MAIRKVGVVGCGLMGIRHRASDCRIGIPTVVREVSAELLDKGLKSIDKNLNRLAEKGTITEAAKGEIRRRLKEPRRSKTSRIATSSSKRSSSSFRRSENFLGRWMRSARPRLFLRAIRLP